MQNLIVHRHLGAALHVARTLRAAGYDAYLAGGCVRDLLLGREPKDIDVATSATPDQVQRLFARTEAVGAHFGVILVIVEAEPQRIAIEVATFRNDGAYSDGRRPDAVRFSLDPREDVLRRDFTINGMLLDPAAFDGIAVGDRLKAAAPAASEKTGTDEQAILPVGVALAPLPPPDILTPLPFPDALAPDVLDYVGGRDDLAAGMVRAIGDPVLRFTEDKLRMLRAVRFAARLDFAIEPKTLAAIRQLAPQIDQVSAERVRDELTRMLTEGNARRAFELLDASGLLAEVMPEAVRMHGVAQPPEWHPEGDVWVHTMLLLDQLEAGATATLAWGALLHDIGKPATYRAPDPAKPGDRIRFNGHVEVGERIAAEMLARLRFSNDDTAQILALVANHMRFGDVKAMKQSTLKRFLRLPRFEEHLALHRMDCTGCHRILTLYDYAKEQFERTDPELVRPKLLLTGRDLIAAGYSPSPQFKAMLEAAEDAQLEGIVHSAEEAVALVNERFGPPPEWPSSNM
jgi:poly(A) polymerase